MAGPIRCYPWACHVVCLPRQSQASVAVSAKPLACPKTLLNPSRHEAPPVWCNQRPCIPSDAPPHPRGAHSSVSATPPAHARDLCRDLCSSAIHTNNSSHRMPTLINHSSTARSSAPPHLSGRLASTTAAADRYVMLWFMPISGRQSHLVHLHTAAHLMHMIPL